MDTFSHAIWGAALFGYRQHVYERARFFPALFFGAFPDLASFGLLMFIRFVGGTKIHRGKPPLESLPDWLFTAYDTSHSLVVAGCAILLVSIWRRDIVVPMLAWPFHICLDFPFHSLEYFPTKIFFPLSNFVFDGIRWAQPAVWLPNLAGLIIVLFWRMKRANTFNTENPASAS